LPWHISACIPQRLCAIQHASLAAFRAETFLITIREKNAKAQQRAEMAMRQFPTKFGVRLFKSEDVKRAYLESKFYLFKAKKITVDWSKFGPGLSGIRFVHSPSTYILRSASPCASALRAPFDIFHISSLAPLCSTAA
jgi:hypothetical protein